MNSALTRLVQDVVLRGAMRSEDVAAAIGKPYPTLMRELNPYDQGAKLGAETMLAIVKATGDTSVLEYLAAELGCIVIPGAARSHHARSEPPAQRVWS